MLRSPSSCPTIGADLDNTVGMPGCSALPDDPGCGYKLPCREVILATLVDGRARIAGFEKNQKQRDKVVVVTTTTTLCNWSDDDTYLAYLRP
ncbi:hypothetical protein CIB48_g565 [Xylaria polymorpha]|nr:hypothetical protein CIB48_g565 [Xylaria polymorpha]